MSSASDLHAEMVTTLTLAAERGQSIEETAWDVVHELLNTGSDNVEQAARLLIVLRAMAW